MKKAVVIFIVLFALFLCLPAFASPYYIWNDYGGTWSDANKKWSNDYNLCWAATSSNTLTWAGWNANYAGSGAKFDYFKANWTNVGGAISFGWEWWFDGKNPSQNWKDWSHVTDYGTSGNFYSTAQFTSAFHYYDVYSASDKSQTMATIDSYLHDGYGTGLAIYTDSGGGHAISIWGIDTDDFGNYTGIWITDSDDNTYDLMHYNVSLIDSAWYLEGGHYDTDKWWIGVVDGLDRNPLANSPEPSSLILLLSGLIGLMAFRRKLNS